MKTTNLFLIDGKPMLCPDAGVKFSCEDLDSSESGRDQSGFMHRVVIRYKVPTWGFSYSKLTTEEKNYIESLFPDAATFMFTHPSRHDPSLQETTKCYRSKYSLTWQNAVTGLWSGLSFNIISC